MANAYKCDRCGEFYTQNKNSEEIKRVVTVNKRNYEHEQLDLCDDCVEAFFEFMKCERGEEK